MREIYIAFDIDDTIAHGFDTHENSAELEKREPWIKFFQKKGLLIDAVTPHILCPGIIELLQFLYQLPNETFDVSVKVSFISTGEKKRNELFVKNLLCLALGQEKYELVKDDIKIISSDVIEQDRKESWGERQKKLERLDLLPEQLLSTVLIEDNPFYSTNEQKDNLLLVSPLSRSLFADMFQFFRNTELNWNDFARINHLFYTTGLLLFALTDSTNNTRPLRECLAKRQFNSQSWSIRGGELTVPPPYKTKENSIEYFQYGLDILKTVNPNAAFFCPIDFFNVENNKSFKTNEQRPYFFAKNKPAKTFKKDEVINLDETEKMQFSHIIFLEPAHVLFEPNTRCSPPEDYPYLNPHMIKHAPQITYRIKSTILDKLNQYDMYQAFCMNSNAVNKIKELCDETNSKLVISSFGFQSRKEAYTKDELKALFSLVGLDKYIIDFFRECNQFNVENWLENHTKVEHPNIIDGYGYKKFSKWSTTPKFESTYYHCYPGLLNEKHVENLKEMVLTENKHVYRC
jgi:hypothetical protein